MGLRYAAGRVLVGRPVAGVVEGRRLLLLLQLVLVEPRGAHHGVGPGAAWLAVGAIVGRGDVKGTVEAGARGHWGRGVGGHLGGIRRDVALVAGVTRPPPRRRRLRRDAGGGWRRRQGRVVLGAVGEPQRTDVLWQGRPVVGRVPVVGVVGVEDARARRGVGVPQLVVILVSPTQGGMRARERERERERESVRQRCQSCWLLEVLLCSFTFT